MKHGYSKGKILLALLATLLIIGTLCGVTAGADNVANYNKAYGQVVPTDSNLKAQVSNYDFYGDTGTLYFMQISKGKSNANFAVEIYSDSGYKNQVRSFTRAFSSSAGNTPLKVTWEFKDIVSGTYYGRCYTYVESVENNETVKTVDSSSFCTFTVKINRVGKEIVPLSTLVNTANGPRLTWKTLPTAIKYNVYRKASGDKYWTYLVTLNGQVSTYTDKTAKSGTTYSYTVKCSDGKYVSKYNTTGLAIKCLSMPQISVNGYGSAGYAKISWNAVSGASGYYVYRKGGSLSNDQWTQIAKITNGKTSYYVDTTANSTDWEYTYTVKAYSGYYVSAYNYSGVNFDYIPAPQIKKVSAYVDPSDNTSGVKIEWSLSNSNVTCYNVYRKDGKSWKYLGTTKNTVFIDKTAVSGQTCTYTVKAYSELNAGAYNSSGVSCKYLEAPTLSKITFSYSYASIVKWNKVTGATGYIVYRKVNNAARWTVVATIKNGNTTTFTDTCKKASGYSYTYTVRATCNNTYSYFKEGVMGVALAKPYYSVSQATTEDNSLAIEVKWPAVEGATKYLVYKRTIGGTWACLTQNGSTRTYITDTSFIDTAVENGVTYEYAVRSFNDRGDYSEFYIKTATAVYVPEITNVTVIRGEEESGTQISWNATEDAVEYNVFRVAPGTSEWEKIGCTAETSFFDSDQLTADEPYYYAVSAVYSTLESAKSQSVGNFAEVSLSAELQEYDGGNRIFISWECENETSVTLYKGISEEELVSMGTNDGGLFYSVPDTAVFPGNTYTYKIVITADGKVNGEATVTVKYPHNPLDKAEITDIYSSSLNGIPMITVVWSSVENAEEYIVLRSEDSESWTEVGSVIADESSGAESYSYTDDVLESEKTYFYKVKAVAPVEDRPESVSESSEGILLLSPIGNVHDLIATERVDGESVYVDISWSAADYATGYVVSRTATPDDESSWKILGTCPDTGDNAIGEDGTVPTTFTDATITENGTYYYRVIAVSDEDRGTSQNVCNLTISFFDESDDGDGETTTPESGDSETTTPESGDSEATTPESGDSEATTPESGDSDSGSTESGSGIGKV